jgi:hypothetical protein
MNLLSHIPLNCFCPVPVAGKDMPIVEAFPDLVMLRTLVDTNADATIFFKVPSFCE